MADLFNQQISATYSGLLKTSSSGVLSASLSQISDGRGNTSPLYLSTSSIQFYGAYSFPNADGSANQVLKTDGAGVLTWENDSLSNTLNFSGGTGTGSVTLDTQTLVFTGTANEIVTSASSQAITLSFPTAGVTLPDGSEATTQTASDNSLKVATTAYVDNQVSTVGTVTSVALSVPTGLTVTGSPITTSGTITIGGTLGVANGGTGATTLTGILVGNGTSDISAVTDGTVGKVLSTNANGTYSFIDAAGGDVTKTGAITENQIAVWNDSTDELRSDETVTIGTDHSITLLQKNSLDDDRATYNIGGGNIDDVTGQNNVGFGKDNLGYLVSGQDNNAFGNNSQISNSSGSYNTSFGNQTLNYHSSSDYNVAIGYQSLRGDNIGGTPSSDNNTAIGTFSLRLVDGGNSNTAIGINSGSAITTGSNNVIIGSFTGFRAAVVGGLAEYSIITSNNNIVISDGVGNVRQVIDSSGRVGFGTENPTQHNSTAVVHIHNPNANSAELHLTDLSTGSASTDGSVIHQNASNLYIQNHEAGNTQFYNSGSLALSISSGGAATFSKEIFIGGSSYTTNPPTTKIGMYTSTRAYIQQVSGGSLEFWSSAALPLVTISSGGDTTFSNRITATKMITSGFGGSENGALCLRGAAGSNQANLINFGYDGGNYQPAYIGYLCTSGASNTNGALIFATRGVTTDSEPTERLRISSGGTVSILSGLNPDLDVKGTVIIRGNSSAYTTHYLTTAAANVAKYDMLDASGNIKNSFSAGGTSYITGGDVGIGFGGYSGYRLATRGATSDSTNYAFFVENSLTQGLLSARNDGYIRFNSLGTYSPYQHAISGRDLIINSSGELGTSASIRKAKINIESETDVSWLYDLNPVKFNYRKKDKKLNYLNKAEEEQRHGLIAEEVEEVNTDFCWYNVNEKGEKDLAGVDYKMLITPMLKAIQEQQTIIEDLKARIEQLEG